MTKTWYVGVPEIHTQTYKVEAEDADKAKEIVEKYREEGTEHIQESLTEYDLDYSHTLEPDEWSVHLDIWGRKEDKL